MTDQSQAESPLRFGRSRSQGRCFAVCARIERHAVVGESDRNTVAAALNRDFDVKIGVAQRGITQDIPDNLFEYQLDVVAYAGAKRLPASVESAAELAETMSKTAQRAGKSNPDRKRIDAMPLETRVRSGRSPTPPRRRAPQR